jgi:hypothetical protein
MCPPGEVLSYLLALKRQGLISGDLITKRLDQMPHRMTNIRLTYVGIRRLRE